MQDVIKNMNGLDISVNALNKNVKEVEENLVMLLNYIKKLSKIENFNPSSADDIRTLIYEVCKCGVKERDPKGKPSIATKIIKQIASIERTTEVEVVKDDLKSNSGVILVSKDKLNRSLYPVVVILKTYKEQRKLRDSLLRPLQDGTDKPSEFIDVSCEPTDIDLLKEAVKLLKDNLPSSMFKHSELVSIEDRILCYLKDQHNSNK